MDAPLPPPAPPTAAPGRTPGPAPAPPASAPAERDVRRATRSTSRRVVGGVSAGLAEHLGIPVLWVRVAFVLTTLLSGFGVMFYAALWLVLPTDQHFEHGSPGAESATRTGKRPGPARRLADSGPAIALAAVAFGLVLLAQGVLGGGGWLWPVALLVAGGALLWRQADEAQRERWLDSTGRLDPVRMVFGDGGWSSYARVAAGLALLVAALLVFAFQAGSFTNVGEVAVAGLLGVGGLGIVLGPWIVRLASDLSAERAERVRSQERADLAAHLHDSVLQTLALIQKNAEDGPTVARLARTQERDLRSWLYEGESMAPSTLAGALREAAAVVEDAHGVVVDVVTVGDWSDGEAVRPLVEAAREAMTNAAKHAGTGRVDVYAEVVGREADVFVRDRGPGFDLDAVAEDRLGVRRSIIGRMERHGGSAEIRADAGRGTEVRLHLPLAATEPDGHGQDQDDQEERR